jgi:3-hydroxyacyl-[acyl-carrier-protein] dehydratase
MDFDEIRRLLPQEEPFIFVDKVIELEKGKRITCLKNVSGSAPWVKSHFPGFAVMPGVLLLEALAQSSLILLLKSSPDHKNKIGLFGAVRARFLKPVVPGDQLIMEVKIDKAISTGAIVSAETVVNGEKVVTATLTFGIQEKK